jgi:phosphoribosylamine--glycine ligase
MKVAIIGTGGREHALAVKSLQSSMVDEVHVIPGNTGMEITPQLFTFTEWDGTFPALEHYMQSMGIGLAIIGNESYLESGIVDYFKESTIQVFGPTQEAAQLETSKDFAKQFMQRHTIPSAAYKTCTHYTEAWAWMVEQAGTLVIKQDGLAFGKGVLVTEDRIEADLFVQDSFAVTNKVIFEEFLEGKEFSLLAFVNQNQYNLMIPARDYKRAFDHDAGLNTGGMGAYTPVEYVTQDDLHTVEKEIVIPTIKGLIQEGIEFCGIIYFGLMKTREGVKVIEYNTRFGDPETEVLLEAMESDLIEAILATMEKKPYQLKWKKGAAIGVCLASEGYPGAYKKGVPIRLTEQESWYSMAVQKQGEQFLSNGGRVLIVVASGETIEEARSSCYAQIQNIACKGLYYRSDIGLVPD